MKLLDRYVATVLLRHFGVALAALLVIFSVINLTEEMRLIDATYRMSQALWFLLLTAPAQLYEVFPPAALLGAVMGLGQLLQSNELVAMQAAGVSTARISLTVLTVAGVIASSAAGLGELVAAPLNQRAHAMRAQALSADHTRNNPGIWMRDGSRFVYVGEVHPDGSLGAVSVFDFDSERALRRYTYAQMASPDGSHWTLHDLQDNEFVGDKVSTQQLATQRWEAPIDSRRLRALRVPPEGLSIAELRRTVAALRAQHESPLRYELAFWQRVSAPLYVTIMVLLALPLTLDRSRGARRGELLVLGVLIGLGFQMFQRMFTNFGLAAGLPPLLTALTPASGALVIWGGLSQWQARR